MIPPGRPMDRETLLGKLKLWWQSTAYVPDCPACHGTGNVNPRFDVFAQSVYWKGLLYRVCHNCEGRGKV